MKIRFDLEWLELKSALTSIGKLEKMNLPKEAKSEIQTIKNSLQYNEFAEQLKGFPGF